MKRLTQSNYWYMLPAAAAALLAARAEASSVSVQTLNPVSNGTYQLTEDARGRYEAIDGEWDGDRFFFNGQYNFIDDPLVRFNPSYSKKLGTVVDSIHTLNVTGGLFFRPGLSVALSVPLNIARPAGSSGRFALGDSRVQAKFRLTSAQSATHFSIAPELWMPTGSQADYLSSGTFGGGIVASLERDFGRRMSVALNLGYRNNPGAIEQNLDYRQMLPIGIGAFYRLSERWGVNAEAVGSIALPLRPYNNPGDFYLGGRYQFSPGVALSSGAAFRSLGTDNDGHFRWVVGFSMSPQPKLKNYPADGTDRLIIRHSSTEACGIRPYTATFAARPLNASEMSSFAGTLPYRSARHKIPTLQIGQKTGLAQKGIPYVKDSQVLFAVDVTNLPPAQAVQKADSVALKLNVTKVSSDPYTKTELLCMLGNRMCSGDVFEDRKWVDSINPNFFRGELPRNRAFSSQYLSNMLDSLDKDRLYSSEITLEFSKLMAAYQDKGTPMSVLYGPGPSDKPVTKHTLYFAVADDTYVGSGDANLVVNLTEDTCKTLELTSAHPRPTVDTTIMTSTRKGRMRTRVIETTGSAPKKKTVKRGSTESVQVITLKRKRS